MTKQQDNAALDPTVESAPPEGWWRWAEQLGRHGRERLAGFGGVVMVGFVGGVLVLYGFAWLANEVLEQETRALDDAVRTWLHQFSSPPMDLAMRAISFMGSEVILVLAVLLGALFVWQRRWGAAALLVLVSAGAHLLNNILKDQFQRARPLPVITFIDAQQFSFPSGHAMVSAAFYAYLAYLVWRLVDGFWRGVLLAGLLLLVLLIGVSRLYLEAHYLSDVLAGYLAGLLWTDAVIIASRLLEPRTLSR
jgi:membrane-associated phospholipid phosphatase